MKQFRKNEYEYRIRRKHYRKYDYRPITVGELRHDERFEDADIIRKFDFVEREIEHGFGYSSEDGEVEYEKFPVVTVERSELETDDQYVERLKVAEKQKKEKEEREYLEYLRLKAKFEE
jgi:hypothetical protein